LPAPPLASEPEEYWPEDEEEVYDEQGYTTAHSFRSRGDNTTGGATTVIIPKVTNKVRRELEDAKQLVVSVRTQEDIEDEMWDTSMVAEYGEEIFSYMRELEVSDPTDFCHALRNNASVWPTLRPQQRPFLRALFIYTWIALAYFHVRLADKCSITD
jgi:hypothetical protein